jgi:hypothetical protein
MKRREFNRLLGALAAAPVLTPRIALAGERRRWTLTADLSECCSCRIPCSCNFGRAVDTCFGNRLIQIREGDYEGASLAGVNFLVTFQMGQWTRIYVDDSMDAARSAAFDAVFPVAFAGFSQRARVVERVPLTISSTADTFSFTTPESAVEMRLLPGLDGGPIRVDGLPNPAYRNYVQYESVVHRHTSADGDWSYSGTNGFRSEMRSSG